MITLGPLLQEASLISLSLKLLFLQLCYVYVCEHPVCHYCCWVRLYPLLAELAAPLPTLLGSAWRGYQLFTWQEDHTSTCSAHLFPPAQCRAQFSKDLILSK